MYLCHTWALTSPILCVPFDTLIGLLDIFGREFAKLCHRRTAQIYRKIRGRPCMVIAATTRSGIASTDGSAIS
jgi:hypothetical protein